jgi:transglutaminase-like putative cysteine protease
MYLGTATSQTSTVLKRLAPGREGVRATLEEMRNFVIQYKKNLQIRETAGGLVRNLSQKNFLGEVKVFHRFVRDNIRYLRDIHGVETIQSPVKTLEYGYGDCDDKSTLLAALLESAGHPSRFVAVGKAPDKFSHVYVETLVGQKWYPLETTEPVPPGWAPPGMRARMIVHN